MRLLARWPVIGHQHEDMAHHRFGSVDAACGGRGTADVHVIVVHLAGSGHPGCARWVQLQRFIEREVPHAPLSWRETLNDWGQTRRMLAD